MFGFFGRVGRAINDTISGDDGMVTRKQQVRVQDPRTGTTQTVEVDTKQRREPDTTDEPVGAAATLVAGNLLLGAVSGDGPAEAGTDAAVDGGGDLGGDFGMGDFGLGDSGDF